MTKKEILDELRKGHPLVRGYHSPSEIISVVNLLVALVLKLYD